MAPSAAVALMYAATHSSSRCSNIFSPGETKLQWPFESNRSPSVIINQYVHDETTGWPVCHDMKQGAVNQVL